LLSRYARPSSTAVISSSGSELGTISIDDNTPASTAVWISLRDNVIQ